MEDAPIGGKTPRRQALGLRAMKRRGEPVKSRRRPRRENLRLCGTWRSRQPIGVKRASFPNDRSSPKPFVCATSSTAHFSPPPPPPLLAQNLPSAEQEPPKFRPRPAALDVGADPRRSASSALCSAARA